MPFRDTTPCRRTNIKKENDYKKYRKSLRDDFKCRCGYCNTLDIPHSESFEIDHFVPIAIDNGRKTDYNNLVYSCKSCNNSKRAKWPTGDKTRPNDGHVGWIDPCDENYSKQFTRDLYGGINAQTEIGRWMYDSLKLWKPQHEILWCYENIGIAIERIMKNIEDIHDEEKLKTIIRIQVLHKKILERLFI